MAARDEEQQKSVRDTLTALHDLSLPAAGVVAEPLKRRQLSLTEAIDALSDVFGMASPAERVAALFLPKFRDVILSPVPGTSTVSRALSLVRAHRRGDGPSTAFELNEHTAGLFAAVEKHVARPTPGLSVLSICDGFVRLAWRGPRARPWIGDNAPIGAFARETVGGGGGDEVPSPPTRQIHVARVPAGADTRVDIEELLQPPAAGSTRLFHGCSIQDATSLLGDNIDADSLQSFGDFGKSFYTTPHLPCALLYMGERQQLREADGAVVVLDVDTTRYEQLPDVPVLETAGEPWEQVVRGFRKGQLETYVRLPGLLDLVNGAQVLRGPIVDNADDVDAPGRRIATQPRATQPPWTQVAFRTAQAGVSFVDWTQPGNGVVDIHVIRVVFYPQ